MMDPNLILRAGQTADILGAMQTGNALAAQTNQIRQQNALARLYQDHGSSLMDGNTESLNKLSQIDPNAALGIQRDRMNMDVSQHNMDMGRRQDARADQQFGLQQQQWQMKVQDYARGLSAEQAAAEAQQIEAAVKMGLAAQSPEQWDQIVTEAKAPHLVGQFESRRMLINRYREAADILKGQSGPAPQSPAGRVQADINAGFLPQGTPLTSPGVTVNNNAGESEFDKTFAKADADAIAAISDAGISAQRNMSRIDQLSALLEQSPSGFAAMAAQRAGEWGINTAGLDTLQAGQAIINSLVPEQRQPGSGPMSDADLALFKQSLPRLINQPVGNRMIIDTMRGIAQYDAEGAVIAQRLRAGEIDRSTAFQMLQSRENPLSRFVAQSGQSGEPDAPAQATAPAKRMRFNPQTGEFE